MTDDLKEYYFTFMFKQATKNQYVRILATSEVKARDAMFAHFGDKWMTSYTAEKFKGQPERFNLTELMSILVTDYGSSVEYKLIGAERQAGVQSVL